MLANVTVVRCATFSVFSYLVRLFFQDRLFLIRECVGVCVCLRECVRARIRVSVVCVSVCARARAFACVHAAMAII